MNFDDKLQTFMINYKLLYKQKASDYTIVITSLKHPMYGILTSIEQVKAD